jgi:3-oxoadipate enol-lactonase
VSIQFDVVGDGEPLLLLAGQANSRHWWDPVRDDLAARHRTVALDALGTGASTPPDGAEYSTRRFAEDAVAVLDAAGIGRAHVYGTSMGGKVAQWLAIDHPDRVGALVLGCTTPGGPRAARRAGRGRPARRADGRRPPGARRADGHPGVAGPPPRRRRRGAR